MSEIQDAVDVADDVDDVPSDPALAIAEFIDDLRLKLEEISPVLGQEHIPQLHEVIGQLNNMVRAITGDNNQPPGKPKGKSELGFYC